MSTCTYPIATLAYLLERSRLLIQRYGRLRVTLYHSIYAATLPYVFLLEVCLDLFLNDNCLV